MYKTLKKFIFSYHGDTLDLNIITVSFSGDPGWPEIGNFLFQPYEAEICVERYF